MTVVRQRSGEDCGLGALSSYAGVDYDAIARIAARIDPYYCGARGLHNSEVIAIARRIRPSVRLWQTRRFDLDRHHGILRVFFEGGPRAKSSPGGHFVAVRDGLIGCPAEGRARPWRDWLVEHQAIAGTLLRGSEAAE